MKVYILVEVAVGLVPQVEAECQMPKSATRGIRGVTKVEHVTGPYDVIIQAESANHDTVNTHLEKPIKDIPGVRRVMVCPVAAG